MLATDEGRSEYGVRFAAVGPDEGEWLGGLLHSRELAACVVEVTGGGNHLDYVFLAVSPAFEAATGLKDAVGRSMRSLRPDHESYWFELYARVAETGEPVAFEHGARAFDRRFHGYAFRIGVPESRHVCVVFENCVPETSGDVLFSAAGGDARLERFGATLAHELRGPLAALYNGLYIVKRSPHPHEESRWALAMMERQLARLSGFIDDLLDVGRLGSSSLRIERDAVNLRHVISECIDACAAAIDARRHEVTVDADGSDVVVRGDLRRLIQVFTNLLTNSIKYTPPGGHIRIALAKVNGFAVVEVGDDGTGISAEDLPHVFDYFKQGHLHENQPRGGLGIGLSIVRSIVKLHEGTVAVHSDGAGNGSTFTVRLPLSLRAP
jgi:signal transduction histidine kinase